MVVTGVMGHVAGVSLHEKRAACCTAQRGRVPSADGLAMGGVCCVPGDGRGPLTMVAFNGGGCGGGRPRRMIAVVARARYRL